MVRLASILPSLQLATAKREAEEKKAAASRIDPIKVLGGALLGGLTGGWSLPALAGGAISGASAGSGQEGTMEAAMGALKYGTGLTEAEKNRQQKTSESKLGLLKEFDPVKNIVGKPMPEGTFRVSDYYPGMFEEDTYVKRKPPAPTWPGMIGPSIVQGVGATGPAVDALGAVPADVQQLGEAEEGTLVESDNGKKYKLTGGQWQEVR
jgi:hypothetical protein